MRTKEEYENSINSSRLFEIDRESNAVLYKTEWRRFTVLLVEYYAKFVLQGKSLDSYSMELMDTAIECVKYYRVSKGIPFLHYFAVSFRKTMLKSKAKAITDARRGGISISDADDRMIRKILKYAQTQGKDLNDERVQISMSEWLGVTVQKIKEIIDINVNSVVVQEGQRNDDGEEISIFDTIASIDPTPEERLVKTDEARQILKAISFSYSELQERTRPIIKKLITIYILKAIEDKVAVNEYCKGLDYIDGTIMEAFLKDETVPTAREIATMFGVNEASASRTLNNFLEKVRKRLSFKINSFI